MTTETSTPRLLTMTAEEWRLAVASELRAEVCAQAARVQALEQDVETLANSCNSLARETVRLEQERERIKQALGVIRSRLKYWVAEPGSTDQIIQRVANEIFELFASLPPAGEREET